MKIAIGGFFHESNSFNPIITDEKDFIVFHKEEIFSNADSYIMAKGIIEYFEKYPDYEILPTIFAKAVPNGLISKEYYIYLKEKFFEYIRSYGKLDAIVLALHGSMRIVDIGDAEGDLLSDLRKIYPDIPIICGLDMHATITNKMTSNANAFVGFKTAPHIDVYETGEKAAEICRLTLENKLDLQMGLAKLPIMIAGEKSETDSEPMRSLISELKEYEKNDEILAASYLLGFPWADSEDNGVTTLVVTKGNKQKASEVAIKLSGMFKKKSSEFNFSVPSYEPEKALKIALDQSEKLTFLSDSGDNPTAGSTGDNTTMLKLLINEKERILSLNKNILVAGIYDTKAINYCSDHIGETISITVCGFYDTMNCTPVELTGKVIKNWGPFSSDMVLFSTEIFELIIVSKHIGFTDVTMFEAMDIDYINKDLIVVKLGYLTDPFKKIANTSILALTKGCTNELLSDLPYENKDEYVFV
ncbi:MAG: M81 family metallopeptidase [Candidatus Delongbacteria bacterium]|jgi:microcystin degradation protein MlrC|nr:M81 family metallopeptidase [Candidatus Delongbacteria bacterium]